MKDYFVGLLVVILLSGIFYLAILYGLIVR